MKRETGFLIIVFAVFTGMATGWPGWAVPPDAGSAVALHAEGLEAFTRGSYGEAIDRWERELALNPSDAMALNDIGIAYRRLKRPDMAVSYHRRAVQADPMFGHGYYSLGLVSLDTGANEEAARAFERALELGYRPETTAYNLGLARFRLADYPAAEAAFRKALLLGYTPALCNFHLGMVARARYDYEGALKHLEESVKDPKVPQSANYHLGLTYAALGKYRAAREAYQREQDLQTDWSCKAQDANKELQAHLWRWDFVLDLGKALLRLSWLAAALVIPWLMFRMLRNRGRFLRPDTDRTLLFAVFLFFAPFPWILAFYNSLSPPVPTLFFLSEMATRAVGWLKLAGAAILLGYYCGAAFLCYLAACAAARLLRKRALVLALAAVLLIASTFNIYPVLMIGGRGATVNSIRIYKGLGAGVYKAATLPGPEVDF